MADIHRSHIRVGDCTTLEDKSLDLGGSKSMLSSHKNRGTVGFPQPVARFGPITIYVDAELDAFYQSVQWRQTNRSVAELTGELT